MGPIDGSGKPCVWWGDDPTPTQDVEILKGMDDVHAFISSKAKSYLMHHGDLKTWHRKLFQSVVPVEYYAGHYRGNSDPTKPCLAWDVGVNGVPGVGHQLVALAMEDFSAKFQEACSKLTEGLKTAPPPRIRNRAIVEVLAVFVGEFIRIHPFVNGNGRISRLFANYICHRYDLPMPFANPRHRPDLAAYEDAHALSMQGHHAALYVFFLQVLSISRK